MRVGVSRPRKRDPLTNTEVRDVRTFSFWSERTEDQRVGTGKDRTKGRNG